MRMNPTGHLSDQPIQDKEQVEQENNAYFRPMCFCSVFRRAGSSTQAILQPLLAEMSPHNPQLALPIILSSCCLELHKALKGRKEHDCTCNHSSELECLVLLLQFVAMGEWNVGPAIHSSLQYVWPHCRLDAVLGAEDAETRCKACSRFMIKGRRDNHGKRPVRGGTNVWWCTKGTWNRAQGCFTH